MQEPDVADAHPGTEHERAVIVPGWPRGGLAQARRARLVVFMLVLSDVLLAALAWEAASVVQDVWGRGPLSGVAAFSVVPNVVVWVGLRALLGLYPGYGLDAAEELRRQTYAVAATLGITTVFALALHVGDLLSRLLTFAGFLGLAVLAPPLRHVVKRSARKLGLWGKPVVILGSGPIASHLIRTLKKEWTLGFTPVAVFDDSPGTPDVEGVPCGSPVSSAESVAREYRVNTAIIALPASRARPGELADWAATIFRRIILLPELGGVANTAAVGRDLAGIFGMEIKQNLLNPWYRRTKRALDLFGVVAGGALISPLLLILIVLIKVDSPGPAIYGQRRLGAGDHPFCCWKFRTMAPGAEEALDEHLQRDPSLRAEWERDRKLRRDPRLTRTGRFLRASSLDELPQLWNVLRGEMSLVGPRPIVEAEVAKYGRAYELYRRVPPGISGLWQVNGRSDTSYEERVAMDAYYVRNWSVWLDLVILGRTFESVLLRRGAH